MKLIEKERASEILEEAMLMNPGDMINLQRYMADGVGYVLARNGDLIEVDEEFVDESIEDIKPVSEEVLVDAAVDEENL